MNGARATKITADREGSRRRRGARESMERLTEKMMNRANTPLAILLSTGGVGYPSGRLEGRPEVP